MFANAARRFCWGGVVTLTVLSANAQPAETAAPEAALPTTPNQETVDDLFRRARAAQEYGDAETARELYREAWRLQPSRHLAANWCLVEESHGDVALAATLAAYVLTEAMAPEHRERIEQLLSRALPRVAQVQVSLQPNDAELWIDGDLRDEQFTSNTLYLTPGSHILVAMHQGREARQRVVVAEGKLEQVRLVVPAGPETTASTESAEDAAPDFVRRRAPIAVWLTGGFAAAGFAVGVGAALEARAKRGERNDLRDELIVDSSTNGGRSVCGAGTHFELDCARVEDLSAQVVTLENVSTVGLGVGALAAGTAGVLLYIRLKDRLDDTWVSIQPAGIRIGGRF
jgi:hypothetical protein